MTSDDVSKVLKTFKEAITPEMEAPKMKGRGAALFARRRQRMEKYIITDENRNQELDRTESKNDRSAEYVDIDSKKAEALPPTPTTPNYRPTPSNSFVQVRQMPGSMLSGYCTDIEDDRPSYHRNMKVNYFSDCEETADFNQERRGKRNRPVNRRGWETDIEDSYLSEAETPPGSQTFFQPHSLNNVPTMRRVAPPTRIQGSQAMRPSNTNPVTPAKDFSDLAVTKRSWSRVSFCPKKTSPQRIRPQNAVAYPCTRGTPSTVNEQTKIRTAVPKTPTLFKAAFLENRGNTAKTLNRPKTLAVNQVMPKIDERPSQVASTNSNAQVASTPGENTASVISKNVTSSQSTSSHKSSATVTIMTRKNKSRQEQNHIKIVDNHHIHPPPPPIKRTESPNDGDNRRPGSSASAASYVSSNSSTFTSTVPSRCFTPTLRSHTPTGVPKILKIAGSKTNSPNPTESSPTPYNTPTPLEQNQTTPITGYNQEQSNLTAMSPEFDKPPADKKVSACLKVLDPTRSLSLPKPTSYQVSQSPTLSAVLKQETNDKHSVSIGANRQIGTTQDWTNTAFTQHQFPKPQFKPVDGAPQALGVIAEQMKGRGAKMFEKQQRRMHNYTRETSRESYPDLVEPHDYTSQPDVSKPTCNTSFQPPNEVKMGMRDVMGEFQKTSQPGKAKRPSETRRRTKDPLHYQQHLMNRPPSTDDFIESSEDINNDGNVQAIPNFQIHPSANDFVATPPSIPSPNDPRWTFADDVTSVRSASSVSSQKSQGPKTAPKPAKGVIQKQLSRESLNQLHASSVQENNVPIKCDVHENYCNSQPSCDKQSSMHYIIQNPEEQTTQANVKNISDHTGDCIKNAPISGFTHQSNEDLKTSTNVEETDLNAENGFRAPKPKYDVRKSGAQFQVWSP